MTGVQTCALPISIICYSSAGKKYPVASRDELLTQVNSLRKKLTTYSLYAYAAIEDIFDKPALESSLQLKVQRVESSVVENLGGGNFKLSSLPLLAQISSVNGILTEDFNQDGFIDILLAGNFYPFRTEYGPSDASMGLLLLGNGKGKFDPVPWGQSGFWVGGDVRNMQLLNGVPPKKYVVIARNNDKMSLIRFVKK